MLLVVERGGGAERHSKRNPSLEAVFCVDFLGFRTAFGYLLTLWYLTVTLDPYLFWVYWVS